MANPRPVWRRLIPVRLLLVVAALVAGYVFLLPRLIGPDGFLSERAADAGFVLEDWRFSGHQRTSERALTGKLDLEVGQSILAIDLTALADRLKTLPWVRDVEITRSFPGTLAITVMERAPFALWQRDGEVSLIDASGVPIPGVALEPFQSLPLLVGKGAETRGKALYDALDVAPDLAARTVSAIWVGGRRWDLLIDNGMRIKLPEITSNQAKTRALAGNVTRRVAEDRDGAATGLKAAIAQFAALEAKYRILDREIEVVDLRDPNTLTVRLTNEGQARLGESGFET